ncbi:HupE/UreJ family protein [Nitrospina gracilis]|uniref:HupE/UreJ family protein n=1 Tax=Nitrospina gracilis TaxID=35801 RepID=UPI001F3BD691|nr:HupE/UreJ family protein [Nitrospina gracilis]MCF8719886.1 ABC-type antimicrobial peptide transport system permease subunit [Nitrospina gracilis Nb-211]
MKPKAGFSVIACLFAVLFYQSVFAHGMSEAEKNAIVEGGNLQFIWLGASHMLTGFDHLLFVFGFVFFLTTFMDVVKYVTAFTLGHSVTLISATLMGVTANYYLIDAVIALSVCYIGFENTGGFRKYFEKSPNLLLAVFLFGFIHGFGLSTRLQELPLGEEGILLKILSFNLGIELGQIGALGLMLALLFKWRRTRSFLQISSVSNHALIAAGLFFFLMQMHGYSHAVNPDEFGFPADSHFHAHEAMGSQSQSQPIFPGSEYMTDMKGAAVGQPAGE